MARSRDARDYPGARLAHSPGRARFPSISDSSSIYSQAYFSPPRPDTSEIEPSSPSFCYDAHPESPFEYRTHRDRLRDPAVSSLDLDDEHSPGSSLNTPETTRNTENEDEEDDPSHRISIQGPKIRFHSRAPWETGEDTIEEEDSDHSTKSGVFGRKAKSKTVEAGLMRHFGRGHSRPSLDSSRSRIQPKASFETTTRCGQSISRGALYTLVQESFSASSLTVPSHNFPPPSPRTRQNFSLSRSANYPPTTYSTHTRGESQSDSSSQRDMMQISQPSSPLRDTYSSHSPISELEQGHERSPTLSSFRTSQDRSSNEDFIHPYANPNLVVSYSPPKPVPHENVSRIDTPATMAEPLSSYPGALPSTMLPDTPTSSPPPREHVPPTAMRIHGKDISHPIAVFHSSDLNSAPGSDRGPKLMPLHPPPTLEGVVPGWHPQPSSTVTLISLQEAQARERTRSATANSTASPPSQVHGDAPRVPFPEADDSASIASTETSATGGVTRTRVRSSSAGARAKGVFHSVVGAAAQKPERRGSEPAVGDTNGQTLKHKRSGFMRIFNGREREKGRDKERSPPPPVPSLRRIYSEHPHSATENDKPSLSIIPTRVDGRSSTALSESNAEQGSSKFSSHPLKRIPPPLHITTSASSTRSPVSVIPGLGQELSRAGTTDFLKLRPISTTFSSQFADIVAIPEVESISELELDTPTSPSTISSVAALSPFTSASSRPSDDKPSPLEQSIVIKALQEQIISSKKAWQRQIWELQGQVRDLKAELEDLRAADQEKGLCEHCGRGNPHRDDETPLFGTKKSSVLDRPRGRTGGGGARFANGN